MEGRIHSTESFGTVDGPGLRYVVFMQGCPMRCLYCHNPDTWDASGGRLVSADDILSQYEKNRVFYQNGGLTVTGGEPLLQIDFLLELFSKAKGKGIHTCIDTSGITYNPPNEEYTKKLDELMRLTDLVMLDIKHIDSERHKRLTGMDNAPVLAFARYLEGKNVPVWIRHVVVEGYSDREDDLVALGTFIGGLKNVKALDVLPYHSMGEAKYAELGIPYALKGMKPLENAAAIKAKQKILNGVRLAREQKKN
ncbi:MAG: pyruvate formate lyase-activating protein [Ruminococcaceae bacterium]|nr:pyruvate formate lyase-activating protein [Oscillospiraceae bacterium]